MFLSRNISFSPCYLGEIVAGWEIGTALRERGKKQDLEGREERFPSFVIFVSFRFLLFFLLPFSGCHASFTLLRQSIPRIVTEFRAKAIDDYFHVPYPTSISTWLCFQFRYTRHFHKEYPSIEHAPITVPLCPARVKEQ